MIKYPCRNPSPPTAPLHWRIPRTWAGGGWEVMGKWLLGSGLVSGNRTCLCSFRSRRNTLLEEEEKLSSNPAHWSPWHNSQMVTFRFFCYPSSQEYETHMRKIRPWKKREALPNYRDPFVSNEMITFWWECHEVSYGPSWSLNFTWSLWDVWRRLPAHSGLPVLRTGSGMV